MREEIKLDGTMDYCVFNCEELTLDFSATVDPAWESWRFIFTRGRGLFNWIKIGIN